MARRTGQPSPWLWPVGTAPSTGEISQQAGEVRIIRNKPPIISCQPQELSHLLFGLGTWAGRNCSHLINLGTHLPMTQVEAQIPYHHPHNCTLPRVRREPSHPQRPQDSAEMFHMPLPTITMDDDVIQIGSGVRRTLSMSR